MQSHYLQEILVKCKKFKLQRLCENFKHTSPNRYIENSLVPCGFKGHLHSFRNWQDKTKALGPSIETGITPVLHKRADVHLLIRFCGILWKNDLRNYWQNTFFLLILQTQNKKLFKIRCWQVMWKFSSCWINNMRM